MKQFEIQQFGIDTLALVERDIPKPGNEEVLVRMKAASLNFRDLMVATGTYNPKLRRPMVPLSDGAGVVEEVGAGVTKFKKGDRVIPCFMQDWIEGPPTKEKGQSALGGALDGVLREYAVFRQHGLVRSPAFLADEEAAALPCAAVTAWHALFEHTPAMPGDSVLIQGTGGVSIFALQLAAAAGLRTIVTSSSGDKLARAVELGANETINYKENQNWEEAARQLTGGEGVSHVIEVGGSETLPRSLRAACVGGTVSVIGVLSGGNPTASPASILMNSLRVQGIYVGSRLMFENLNRFLTLKKIRPVIDRIFDWTDIKEALQYMQSRQHFGKICLRF